MNPEWVEAGARAYLLSLTGYEDRLTERVDDWDRKRASAVIAAVEPLIRADERERMTLPEWTQVVADARASATAQALADLRAKVDDLRERASQDQGDGYMRNEHRVGQEYAYEEVLALIDEAT